MASDQKVIRPGMPAVCFIAICLALSISTTVADTIECSTGWNGKAQAIPEEWMNDGYCDCPQDGRDEPNTDACSGSQLWPGVQVTETSEETVTFSCPEQPKLKLPTSRLHDGICDCCDGADEAEGVCEDICEEVLRAEREARRKLEEAFAKGHNQRKEELLAFKSLREEKLKEIESMGNEIDELIVDGVVQQLRELKMKYFEQRMETNREIAKAAGQNDLNLAGLSTQELQSLVIRMCQLAGEMSDKSDIHTCIPLRMAGLEMGMTWSGENFEDPSKMKVALSDPKAQPSLQLAERVFFNAAYGEIEWKLSADDKTKQRKRRRLDEVYDDDDSYHHYDDDAYPDYNGGYGDDDYPIEDEKYRGERGNRHSSSSFTVQDKDLTGMEKELIDAVKAHPFSDTRIAFLGRLNEICNIVDEQLKDEENAEENEEGEMTEPAASVDPAAAMMMRTSLRKKEKAIEKGFKWGASALLFFHLKADLNEEQLLHLTVFSLFHGNLSSIQLWQILQKTLNEFATEPIDEETCASPWATSCPPKTITRKGLSIPSASVVKVAEAFCSGQADAVSPACAAKEADSNGIPIAIPDGYYGYYTPVPRNDQDSMASIFGPLTTIKADREGLEALEKEKERIEKERKSLEHGITQLWKDIGGEDGDMLGPNGELHALANKCFDVQAGKYTYEVCLFGEAKQKEGSNKSGTSLGRYQRMEYDNATGQRVLYWDKGQKCWNGPQRSATVYVTCGAETKVLSADEPDTCRYVLQMESHIACDEAFKERMGL